MLTRSVVATAVVATLVLALAGSAVAAWVAAAPGSGFAAAAQVNQGQQPTVELNDTGGVDVAWAAASLSTGDTVDAYEVRRYAGQTSELVCDGAVAALSCSDSTVTPGTYTYTVLPLVGGNWRGAESTASAAVEIVAPPTGPAAPTGLDASATSSTSILLTWDDNADDETSFVVERLTGVDTFTTVATLAADTTEYSVTGLTCGTDYTFRVVASNDDGDAASGTATATTSACSAPGAPVLTLTPVDPTNATSATFEWTHEDAGATFTCTLDGSVVDSSCTSPKSYSGMAAGQHTFSVVAVKHGLDSAAAEHAWLVDTTPPATSDNTASYSAWRKDPVTVTLTPTDPTPNASGVVRTYYTTDGSTPTTASSQGTSITLAAPGVHTIKYFSVDAAGNAEAVTTAAHQIRIDTTAPVTTDDAPSGWSASDVTVTLSPADTGGAGVAATYYTTNGTDPTTSSSSGTSVTLTAGGTHTLKYRSADAAGNLEAVKSATVRIDRTAPTVTITGPTATTYSNNGAWNGSCGSGSNQGFCGTAADAGGAGLSSVQLSLRRLSDNTYFDPATGTWASAEVFFSATLSDDSTSWRHGWSFSDFPADGDYTLRARSRDGADNTSALSSVTFYRGR